MTLDQSWKIFENRKNSKINNAITTNLFFLSWVILAALIFQNLFTGVMVNNFYQIREDFVRNLNIKTIRKKKKESARFEAKF